MKKIILLTAILLPILLMAAAPTFQSYYSSAGDVVIDSSTGNNWEVVDSLIVTASDSAYATIKVTGTALMNPYDRMYLGFGNDSANRVDSATSATTGQTNSNIDTNLVKLHPTIQGAVYLPFIWEEIVSMDASQVDTFYLNIATGSDGSKISLFNVMMSAEISDRD